VRRILLILLLCLAALPLFASSAFAFDRVTVLVSGPSPAGDEFLHALRQQLDERGKAQLSVRNIADASPMDKGSLVIAVGVQALQHAARLKQGAAVLGVLIPHPAFERIRATSPHDNLSAILLDQPPARHMHLLRHLLPESDSVGILFGPSSSRVSEHFLRAARDHRLKPVIATIQAEDELLPALKPLLESTDALLAVPDPVVHQSGTAQTLLLTSYRYRKPVIGYSLAYVTAGALAAVYSSPADIARQAAEITRIPPERQLPPPQAPRYFSVGVNRQVARSLGLEVPDDAALMEALIKEEQ
jgi:putative ABC transport system substrate-binding protein